MIKNHLNNLGKNFKQKLVTQEEKNLESILSISNPELKENDKIEYTLTNNTSKLELNKNKNELIDFLKKDLKNDNISIEVKVNKLKEKNSFTHQQKNMIN